MTTEENENIVDIVEAIAKITTHIVTQNNAEELIVNITKRLNGSSSLAKCLTINMSFEFDDFFISINLNKDLTIKTREVRKTSLEDMNNFIYEILTKVQQ